MDSHSKWLEIEWMRNGTDAPKVIRKFAKLFSSFGLPDVIVTDGGPPFNSSLFVSFLERQGVLVMKSPPYNPSSNGQAERMVRLVKEVFKKYLLEPEVRNWDVEDQINYFLINYRNTCVTTDGSLPSEKIFNYKPKMLIDLINPKSHYSRQLVKSPANYKREQNTVTSSNQTEVKKDQFDRLMPGDKVWLKNNHMNHVERWIAATFVRRLSLNVFQVAD